MPSAAHALDRVSIIPRGRTGGVTMFQQDEDRVDHSQSELIAMLDLGFFDGWDVRAHGRRVVSSGS